MSDDLRLRSRVDDPASEYEIGQIEPPPVKRKTPSVVWLIGILVVVAALVAWYIVMRGPIGAVREAANTAASSPAATPQSTTPALGAEPADVAVPPLDESDPVVRELVRQLTSHPTVAAWLATDGLVRNFTVSLANVADGVTPERHLRVLRPQAPFAVVHQGDQLIIDPASYDRYDNVAAAVASVDAQGAARLYATLKPRITEAYRDLGHPDTPVDQAVERAIVLLLRTPIVDGPIRVQPAARGIGYAFSDPRLEALSSAQKQLLRMGPDNVRTIQRSLRQIALALGIPSANLPQPQTT